MMRALEAEEQHGHGGDTKAAPDIVLTLLSPQISDWDTGKKIASGTHTKTWRAVGAKL